MPKFTFDQVPYESESGAVFALTVSPAIKALMPGQSSAKINDNTPQITIRGELPNPRGLKGKRTGGDATAPDTIFIPVATVAQYNALAAKVTKNYKGGVYTCKKKKEKQRNR